MSVVERSPSASALPSRHPRARRVLAIGVACGVLLAVVWSFRLVDTVIGGSIAHAFLGEDAEVVALSGVATGFVFAFVTGFAGTFTACNIAMAAAIGPMSESSVASGAADRGSRDLLGVLLRPVAWLTAGMVAVSGLYGFFGVVFSDVLPQLSTDATASGVPIRLLQASVVFGVIGVVLIWLGLASLGIVRDVFANRPVARVVLLGALVGGFVVGRPYPLFNKLFQWAAHEGNPFVGAGAFILQSLGNVFLITLVYVLIVLITRGGFLRLLAGDRIRLMAITGGMLIALGVFLVVYWDLRVPARFGWGWFPMMPYE